MFQRKGVNLDASMGSAETPGHGPYRATKLWNSIVQDFRGDMQCKKHRRHLKTYNSCFTAMGAIDFLQELLNNNPNMGKDVARHQTIQLLRKFLKNHVIEDVQGRWGSENFEDDGRLYRFPLGVTTAEVQRQPLAFIDKNVERPFPKSTARKEKRKRRSSIGLENNNIVSKENRTNSEAEQTSVRSSSSTSVTSWEYLKRQLPPAPTIKKCRVISQGVTKENVQDAWKKTLLNELQKTLHLDTLEDIVAENQINGDYIRHNTKKVGQSGVVQVDKDEDIPYWALSAMTCLANWPNSTVAGLPCYPGFENDVFKAICEYYCGLEPVSLENYGTKKGQHSARRQNLVQQEPLLTYEYFELFTNIVCLIQPGSEKTAVEALRYAFLILPPINRRKLHLLVRLMSKMCSNPHLTRLEASGRISIRTVLLQTFSRYILSCSEEVYLDELLANRLASFLIDNHSEVMKVPAEIEKTAEDMLEQMRKTEIRGACELCEEVPNMHGAPAVNHSTKSRQRNTPHVTRTRRYRRKSVDLMKSWVTSIKGKPVNEPASSATEKSTSSDSNSYVHLRLRPRNERGESVEEPKHPRPRTRTIGSRFDIEAPPTGPGSIHRRSLGVSNLNESRIKPAKSCSDIFDMEPTTKINSKTSDSGSSWNLRLRPVLGKPFSKFRRSKV